jgi:tetratricopeptide (TPR) repeat protein
MNKKIFLLIIFIINLIWSCKKADQIDFENGKKEVTSGNFRTAISYFEKVIQRDEKSVLASRANEEAAHIALYDIKDFERAIKFYKNIVLSSNDIKQRVQAQRQIAQIYFDNLNNYEKAIIEYSKLLELPHSESDESIYKIAIARSYYYLGNFAQAESETDEHLRKKLSNEQEYDLLLLKANLRIAQKDHQAASLLYAKLISKYPERSKKEDIFLSLVLCYEELGDYKKALDVLEILRPTYKPTEYLDLKIKRLLERQKNQPKGRLKK